MFSPRRHGVGVLGHEGLRIEVKDGVDLGEGGSPQAGPGHQVHQLLGVTGTHLQGGPGREVLGLCGGERNNNFTGQ